tara:strand:+ start:138 stop:704 length:567 start_codon:yes stop_codon:yes gene_type:complete
MGTLTEFSTDTGRSKYATMQEGTTAEMLLYTDQTIGSQWFDTTLQKVWTWSDKSVWFVVGETMVMAKQSVEIIKGQLMIPDTTISVAAEVASTAATNQIIGVAVWSVGDAEEFVVVAYSGVWDVLCSDDSNPYTIGMFLVHDGSPTAEDGMAKERSSGSGHMAICLEDGSVGAGGGALKCQVQTTERY